MYMDRSALTHDIYAVAAEEILYDQVWPLKFSVNLQGFYSVHRFAYYNHNDNTKDDTNWIRRRMVPPFANAFESFPIPFA